MNTQNETLNLITHPYALLKAYRNLINRIEFVTLPELAPVVLFDASPSPQELDRVRKVSFALANIRETIYEHELLANYGIKQIESGRLQPSRHDIEDRITQSRSLILLSIDGAMAVPEVASDERIVNSLAQIKADLNNFSLPNPILSNDSPSAAPAA
jgi:hypothetical protein